MDAEGEGGTVGGNDAVSGFRIGNGERAGQGVIAGSVWADCEEGRHLWIPFVFVSQDHIGVSNMPVCETDTPILRSECVRVCGKCLSHKVTFYLLLISTEIPQLPSSFLYLLGC